MEMFYSGFQAFPYPLQGPANFLHLLAADDQLLMIKLFSCTTASEAHCVIL